MTGPSGESCEKCYFWDKGDLIDRIPAHHGFCNRFPPVLRLENESLLTEGQIDYRQSLSLDWCGEFKAKGETE